MPITPATATPTILTNLISTGNVGQGTPKLAAGVGQGFSLWVASIQAKAIASGTLGAGTGLLPLVIPPPAFLAVLVPAAAANKILGVMAPPFLIGLSNGLSLASATGIIQTLHPNVGVGAGTVQFVAPPARPFFQQAFEAKGLKGQQSVRLAKALGQALDNLFRTLTYPIAVVGSPSIVPSAGPGTGKII